MYEWRRVDVCVVVIPWIQLLKYSDMCIVHLYLFFSTMPELHTDGLSTYHNSSKKMNDFEINNVISSSLMVTERSQNWTTATSNPYTIDSGNSFSGIVIIIIFFCSTLAIIIAIGILLARKRQVTNTRESQVSNSDGASFSCQCHVKLNKQTVQMISPTIW